MSMEALFKGDPDEAAISSARPDEQRLDAADAGNAIASNQEPFDILSAGADEAQRLEQAQQIYRKDHFLPVRRKVSFWKDVSPEVAGMLVSGVGAILISALRVGTILFIAEMSLASTYNRVTDTAGTGMGWQDCSPLRAISSPTAITVGRSRGRRRPTCGVWVLPAP